MKARTGTLGKRPGTQSNYKIQVARCLEQCKTGEGGCSFLTAWLSDGKADENTCDDAGEVGVKRHWKYLWEGKAGSQD